MFEEVSALIDKKETSGNLERAVEILDRLAVEHPSNDMVFGKLSHAYYFRGKFAPEGSKQREQMFEHGVRFGEKAVTLEPRGTYGSFWYGSNLGMLGLCRGIMASLRSVDSMKEAMERTLGNNEAFFFAGPHRALGRLYFKLPRWPVSIGDKKKAERHLTRAVELAPEYMPNRLFLAEFYVGTGKKKQARHHLEWLLDRPIDPDHRIEDGEYKTEARALYARC